MSDRVIINKLYKVLNNVENNRTDMVSLIDYDQMMDEKMKIMDEKMNTICKFINSEYINANCKRDCIHMQIEFDMKSLPKKIDGRLTIPKEFVRIIKIDSNSHYVRHASSEGKTIVDLLVKKDKMNGNMYYRIVDIPTQYHNDNIPLVFFNTNYVEITVNNKEYTLNMQN